MVRRFGLSHKGSPSHESPSDASSPFPPPPYKPDVHADPVILGETTTTATQAIPTTQMTTHFFSLPLWRRRPQTASTALARRSLSGLDTDESGTLGRVSNVSMSMLNKDLPPTPTSSDEDLTSPKSPEGHSPSRILDGAKDTVPQGSPPKPITVSPSRISSKSASPRLSPQPTVALAQAALGIGLPHVMPRASSSSTSEVNAVAFINVPTNIDRRSPSPKVRRVKSSQQLSVESSSLRGRRQTRGISLGPTTLHDPSVDVKGKGKEQEPSTDPAPPTKSLVRHPSFWNRKRTESLRPKPEPLSPSKRDPSPQHSLPFLPPVSPFHIDGAISSSPIYLDHSSLQPPPGLARRHSERTPPLLSPALSQQSTNGLPSSGKRYSRRPSTADSTVARERAHSLFIASSSSPKTATTPSLPPTPEVPTHPARPLPRKRAQTNPPLLHRLSFNLLSFGSSHSSNLLGPNSATHSPTASPRHSVSRPSVDIPKPKADEETPELYLSRLTEAVSKAEVATVLASSSDEFHLRALRVYIDCFEFAGDPLDVALRKLLMDVGLPRETQQIDRVMEAFAARYQQCNPSLFVSDDHPYILAFSLIMLHTDAFNKSNKRKMTKADYIKNTRLPGVAPEVLECFYDNIVFAPFIFVEDPLDINGQRGLASEHSTSHTLSGVQHPLPGNGSSVTLLGKGAKIDPYYLIANNLLDPLRVDVELYVPPESPYTPEGTGGPWDESELRRAFAKAGVIEVGPMENRRMSTAFFTLNVGGFPTSHPSMGISDELLPSSSSKDISALKVTKVGLLNRKDVTMEGGKRVMSRKWRYWSVILTGSQLLLFRDHMWATNLLEQEKSSNGHLFPPTSLLKPDELLTVKDAIAVYDRSYTKYEHTFRLVLGDGRQFLLQANDEQDMNEWISRINYASAFKTIGVRMRPLGISGKDVELMGVAAAASHLREMRSPQIKPSSSHVHTFNDRHSAEFFDRLSNSPSTSFRPRKVRTVSGRNDMDLEVPTAPDIDGANQFKETFDQVKADLAAGRSVDDLPLKSENRPRAHSLESCVRPFQPPSENDNGHRQSSRSQVIQSKVQDLESQLIATQSHLDSDLRFVRNIGVLTPFQRSTRERLQVAVQNIAKRIKQMRLNMAKLACHRDVLFNDLIAEERDWYRTKTIALKAATESLHSRRDPSIPRMTLSFHLDDQHRPSTSPRAIPRSSTSANSPRPGSSNGDSFHSAFEFDWSTGTTPDDTMHLAAGSPLAESPLMTPMTDDGGVNCSSSSFPFPHGDNSAPSTARSSLDPRHVPHRSSRSSAPGNGAVSSLAHEKFVTASEVPEEEAEEWNKTRAAKRVSLVRVPSELKLSVPFGRGGADSPRESSRLPWTPRPILES